MILLTGYKKGKNEPTQEITDNKILQSLLNKEGFTSFSFQINDYFDPWIANIWISNNHLENFKNKINNYTKELEFITIEGFQQWQLLNGKQNQNGLIIRL